MELILIKKEITMEGNLFLMKENRLYGFINSQGEYIIKPQYKVANDFNDGFAFVKTIDDKFGYINCENDMVIPVGSQLYSEFSNGRAFFRTDTKSKFGFINKKGEIVIEPQFDMTSGFNSLGMATVVLNGKTGIINTKGEFMMELIFEGLSTLELLNFCQ
jgi:hypothetical protein